MTNTDKVGAEIALFVSLAVLQYIWWPIDKVGAEIAVFANLAVPWYIWWTNLKSCAEIDLFAKGRQYQGALRAPLSIEAIRFKVNQRMEGAH